MAHLHIKSIPFGKTQFGSLEGALKEARNGDVIHLEKNDTIGHITQTVKDAQGKKHKETLTQPLLIPASITLEGPATLTVESGCAGLLSQQASVHFKNLTLKLEAKSNLIKLADTFAGTVSFTNVTFDFGKSDPRDWYPPVFTQGLTAHYQLTKVTTPYFWCQGASVTLKQSKVGSLFGPTSLFTTQAVDHQGCFLTQTRFQSHGEAPTYTGVQTLTQGGLSLSGYSGMQDGLRFKVQSPSKKHFTQSFLDASYETDTVVGLALDQCQGLTVKDYKQAVRLPQDVYWASLILLNSDVILDATQLKPSTLKNKLEASTVKLQDVDDQSQWQEVGKVKKSQASLKREGQSPTYHRFQSLIGLSNVKHQLEELMAMAATNEELTRRGLQANDGFSLHMVFAGSAGTGKTTVAKLFGELLYEEGILPTAKFTIATRKDLVAEYVGQTALKTHALIDQAAGGVLFIDEAYSLRTSPGTNDFAAEAVDQLVMDSEEYRDQLVIILAGYTDEMTDFIQNTNPGLKSRFKNWITFPDYNLEELLQIIRFTTKDQGVTVRDWTGLDQSFATIFNQRGFVEGNARFIRNYVQDLILAKNVRTAQALRQGQNLSDAQLTTIEPRDVQVTEAKYVK